MGLMKSWADSGATSAEVMVLDSMTNIPIAAARDDQETGLREIHEMGLSGRRVQILGGQAQAISGSGP